MAKILFIVPPLTGHINPTVSVGQVLAKNGHEVAWVGYEEVLRRSLPSAYRVYPLDDEAYIDHESAVHTHGDQDRRGFAGLHYLWESVLIPLARRTVAKVESILTLERPDLCIVDQQMLSGAMVCQQLSIPYLTSATTSAALIDALEGLPQVNEWHERLLLNLWHEYGLRTDHIDRLDLSSLGTLAFSSQQLMLSIASDQTLSANIHFVGPALEGQRASIDFPWDRIDHSIPRLFFSMGTVNALRAITLYQRLIEGLADAPIQVIAAAPVVYFKEAPAHWIVQPRVPQLELLGYMSAVFCHGGHNTTLESLAYGLPLLIAPIRDDQPVIAEQIKRVGAGLRVHFSRVKAHRLRALVEELLYLDKYRMAADRVRREFIDDQSIDFQRMKASYPVQLPTRLGAHRASEVVEHILTQL